MKNAKPFVDLGFSIVPIENVLTRKPNGDKVKPIIHGHWKDLYLETRYEPDKVGRPYPITAAFITGKTSGAISIDCDNQQTYDIVHALNPEYEFEFISLGKPTGGGSIIYRLTKELEEIPKFSIHDENIKLDFQTNDWLQFLPTSGNKTKVEWKANSLEELPELEEPPDTVVNYLRCIYNLHYKSKNLIKQNRAVPNTAIEKHYKNLAPFCEAFLTSGAFNAELFRILTPKDGGFRDLEQYKKDSTLHPDNVPQGKGNEYLIRLAGVLVCDSSINPSLFKKMMLAINNMWSNPISDEEITSVINYQLSREEWTYDEDWQDKVSLILTEYGTIVNVFYDPTTRKYYAIDNHMGMSMFNSLDPLPKHLSSIAKGGRIYKAQEIYGYLDKKKTIMSPLEPFGDLEPEHEIATLNRYNLFCRSRQYDILLNPENYKEEFEDSSPETTIAFFKHLIPDYETREYVIRFIYTKLTTLEFSEIILYFLGVQGAGKNLFVDWLSAFCVNKEETVLGNDYKLVVEVDLENFLSKYNLWIVNALFANLDEYGEKTTNNSQDKQVLANLKSYTGKSQIQLRTMGIDPVPAYHKCTFILTANVNRLAPSLDDRRLVLIDNPKPLSESEFVIAAGGKSKAIDKLFKEQELWAYYCATKYEKLKSDDYRTPPRSKFKETLINRHLPPSERIAVIIKNKDHESMIQLCDDNDMLQDLIDYGRYGIVIKPMLKELFMRMTEGATVRKSVVDKAFRDYNLIPQKFWVNKRQVYGFEIPGLKKWANKHIVSDGNILSKLED